MKSIFEKWSRRLPVVLVRSRWNRYANKYGLPHSRSYMAQLDFKGVGPKRSTIGNKVCYLREDYLDWLKGRSSNSLKGVKDMPPKLVESNLAGPKIKRRRLKPVTK